MTSTLTVKQQGGEGLRPPRPRKLTAIAIEKLQPKPFRYEVGDPGTQGLRVQVQPSGHKSFIMRYRLLGKPQKLTLGSVAMGLAAARKLAADAVLTLSQGGDPGAAKREAKAEKLRAALAEKDTFFSVSERFLKVEGPKLRSVNVRRQQLERLIYPAIGVRPIADIKRSEIVRLLDKIETTNGPAMAQAVLSIIRRTMGWHAARSDDFRSPVVRGMGRVNAKERARERTLTDDEIRRVWKAAAGFEGPEGHFIHFLLLTGARRNEVAGLRFDELSGSDWLLPAARNKTKTDLLRPLSAAALEVIAKVPRVSGTYVFSTGTRPLEGFSRFKRRLDAASGVTGWRLHDLRRSARSLMSRAGVASEHAERVLGHVVGGVKGIYDRHSYFNEKKRALEALAAEIERIINPPPAGKVIRMQRG
jgi:integrase